ncbi:MAG: RdgB/HAM1 family non-canonical purine NTP pyrophosphatase [Anaerolineae bacterium]|nr:RdgB/HAM1 family non-canonical purine NTP pyrophosphatase [Anaerolineae bacterium]
MQNELHAQLLLASNNSGKLKELRALLADLEQIVLVTPADLGLKLNVVEDGTSYAENAARKAQAFAQASGLVCLADDSGLEVDALGGAPGLFSARYAPQDGATDADRRVYLLQNLAGKPLPWTARFRAVIALAAPGRELQFAEGVCEGEIIAQERGSGGFGYDPIFLLRETGRTMAELEDGEKNQISHRARAVQAGREMIAAALGLSNG